MGFVIKVLHLCADYPHTNLYKELVENLDRIDIEQIVYIPVKRREDLNKKIIVNLKNTSLVYSKSFNNTDRLFYAHKVNKILYDIKNKVNFKSFNLVHAHFLFSMGGIALKLKREKNIDYIVAVRSTDVNLFF